jgi:hypothetical protein
MPASALRYQFEGIDQNCDWRNTAHQIIASDDDGNLSTAQPGSDADISPLLDRLPHNG